MSSLQTRFPRDVCAYCGSDHALERDHIPPKNLFPPQRPSNLITVPACSECHSDTAKDDEYFRMKVCFRDDAGDHPKARANWDSILRSLQREEAKGLRKSFLSDIHPVQLRTQAGLHVGRGVASNIDPNRIRRVVERIVRGLYFAESCQPLGLSNEVAVHTDEDLELQSPESLAELNRTILLPLASLTPKVIGDGVFTYRFQIMEEDPAVSVWALSFFEQVHFLCITGSDSMDSSNE